MRRSVFWPLLWIIVGVALPLSNFGLIRVSARDLIRSGWPVLLIAGGLAVLLGAYVERWRKADTSVTDRGVHG